MSESSRPSKQFLIRGAIAIGVVALIFVVQSDWFRALFNKSPLVPTVSNKTVGEFISQDSNGNGISDWEEKLWGLDPTVLYTDGVSHKSIIEERKRALGVADASAMPENETDALARELLIITAALGTSGELTDESLAAVGAQLAESVEFQRTANHYSLKDLRTVQTTSASLEAYYDAFTALARKYQAGASEIDIIVTALDTGDLSSIGALESIKASYEKFTRELVSLPVPVGLQRHHLEIINSIYGLSIALSYIQELSDNSANALAGVALYKINDARLFMANQEIQAYLQRYGILEP